MVDLVDEEDGYGYKCDDGNDDVDFFDLEDKWWLIVVDKFVIQVFFNDVFELWTNVMFWFGNFGFGYVLGY